VDRGPVLDRLRLAREFLGTQDPLDFFRTWTTPEERYTPVYADDAARPEPGHEDA
jgi:hypothetical protein